MSARVCVVGSFMMDLVASAPRRPARGETVIGTEFSTFLGGKGFNQAVAAARAGAETVFVGRLGDDDFGEAFRKALRAEGIDDSAVATDSVEGTGVGLPVLEPGGQNSIIVIPRANGAVEPEHIREHAGAIERADVVLVQLELPLPAVVEAARVARRSGTRVILNPAPYTGIAELRGLVDVLVPNEVELAAISGGHRPGELEMAARRVRADWGCNVVATLGEHGAVLVGRAGDVARIEPHRVDAVDTIGAGDTFCGYLARSLASGTPIGDAVRVANAAAALAVTRRGAADSAPRSHEVAEFVARFSPDAAMPRRGAVTSKEATTW